MRTHKAVPVSMTEDLLAQVDARARALGLSRSTYIQQLVRADLGMGSSLTTSQQEAIKPANIQPIRYGGDPSKTAAPRTADEDAPPVKWGGRKKRAG